MVEAVERKKDQPHYYMSPCKGQRVARRSAPDGIILSFFIAIACLSCARCWAQSTSDDSSIRGIVVNSVTREPIARALVSSLDNRFATLTNSEGQFEFSLPAADPASEDPSDSGPLAGRLHSVSNRPYALTARKPGFLSDPNIRGNNLPNGSSKELTLALTPEALIIGTVTLPTAEAPDPITLEIFRREVQNGRAHWVRTGSTQSTSDGQFRFANLSAGTYKLLTSELLDRDPLDSDSLNSDPFASDTRGPLFGYPPVYYQNAPDFGSASTIQLAAGQTQTVGLSLVKQPYYRVKVPVIMPVSDGQEGGVEVSVYANGHKGPGFSLGYNNAHHQVEGLLPSGTYTIEASTFGQNVLTGIHTITINGAPIDGPAMALAGHSSIPVYVKEEFTSADHTGSTVFSTAGGSELSGPRRYLNVTLASADDFGIGRDVSLRQPAGPPEDALTIEGAAPGSYWVRVDSSRGYAASIRSGNLDLQHRPLVVGAGGGAAPVEITMRDDTAEISGTVDGITRPAQVPGDPNAGVAPRRVHVDCVPLADSSGQFAQSWVHADGTFDAQGLAPGTYRLLAFDGEAPEFEYRNPEAMQAYESKGSVVRLTGGQKERVQLQLVSTSIPGND